MRAVFYHVNPAGWATCKWLRRFWKGCLLTRLNGLALREVDPPQLPGDDWVLVRTLLGGICGSDAAVVGQKQPPNSILQAFSSMPFVLGHENVSLVHQVGPAVDASWQGRRVCVEPTLCCEVRGIAPPCPRCQAGEFGACESFAADGIGTAGLARGTSQGYCRTTGGSHGEFFVAHVSQLVGVPEAISDAQAVLTDPAACSLHAVGRVDVSGARRVLVYGAGVLGLGVVASLRAVGYTGQIHALDRHDYLAEHAGRMGADEYLRLPAPRRERFGRIAELTGATVQRARFGNYMLSGGYDVVFDCVGSKGSMNESLKWTRARGQVVFVGTGHGGGVDLTPIWFRELSVIGAYGRQLEHVADRRVGTYQLVHELMLAGKLNVDGLLTHTFRVDDYRRAYAVSLDKAPAEAVKVALDFR